MSEYCLPSNAVFSHPNALVRATTARLIEKMVEIHGPSKVLALSKDKKDAILQTVVKFLMDGNLQTRYVLKCFISSIYKNGNVSKIAFSP